MVGEADEVVARIAVRTHGVLRLKQAVGPVGVAVEVAAEEAAFFSVLEQILYHGSILRHLFAARYVERFSSGCAHALRQGRLYLRQPPSTCTDPRPARFGRYDDLGLAAAGSTWRSK